MNFQLIGQLIRLRYKLLWAKTRTRNGKIALFMTGYLLLVAVGALLAAGGLGAGIVAVKSGKAELIAQSVLTGLALWAIITSVMLGFGMNAAFSDAELRRYPLKAHERRFARHFSGAVDPFWFLFLMLCVGLALGLYLYDVGSLLLGLIAVVLVYVCTYLAAQVLALVLDRVMQRRGGSILLPLLIMALCFLPGVLAPKLADNKAAAHTIVRVIGYSPTFGAGSMMTRTGRDALYGFGLVAWWIVGLTAALVALERRPPKARSVQASRIQWDSFFDRTGARFGPRYGPLVAHWLLFYSRCKRLRISYLMSLPLVPFLLLVWTRQGPRSKVPLDGPNLGAFAGAVGVFAICGLAPAAAAVVNAFGYVGGGFRRYFLFPGDPGASLRAASYALLIMSAPGILLATLAWVAFPPVPLSAQAVAMLVFSGLAGMFAFHGAGLWTTLYGARRGNPNMTMGNDLSAAGNVLLIGGMILALMGPRFAGMKWKGLITPDGWWVSAILAILAGAFYLTSLRAATAVFSARRERLLAVLEGKA